MLKSMMKKETEDKEIQGGRIRVCLWFKSDKIICKKKMIANI